MQTIPLSEETSITHYDQQSKEHNLIEKQEKQPCCTLGQYSALKLCTAILFEIFLLLLDLVLIFGIPNSQNYNSKSHSSDQYAIVGWYMFSIITIIIIVYRGYGMVFNKHNTIFMTNMSYLFVKVHASVIYTFILLLSCIIGCIYLWYNRYSIFEYDINIFMFGCFWIICLCMSIGFIWLVLFTIYHTIKNYGVKNNSQDSSQDSSQDAAYNNAQKGPFV